MPSLKISLLMAGGGTGGHLWPGVALGQAIKKLNPQAKVTFFVPGKPVDHLILSSTDFPVYTNPMRSFPFSPYQYPIFLENFFVGIHKTLNVFRRCQPNLVIGLGGYGSLSASLLAWKRGIPLVMIESNKIAGKVVKWFAKWCECIYTSGETIGIPVSKINPLGIPIRFSLPLNREKIGKSQITILVMGGSQGAECLNKAICEALPFLHSISEKIHFIHLCGKNTQETSDSYQKNGISHRIFSFYNKMEELYRECDLIICRAGGSTLSEITALGLPSILVPFAKAADGHQEANASAMEKAGASYVIREKELTGELLAVKLMELFKDEGKIEQMSASSRAIGKPNAAEDIALDICNLLESKISKF